jgi:hypothetical protein
MNILTLSVMKKRTLRNLSSLFIAVFIGSLSLVAQKENFDLLTFTPPSGWNKTLNSDVLMYSSPENDSGAYCLITIYKSINGSGHIAEDFSSSWNTLAATRLNIAEKPQSGKGEPENGWESQTGSASFTLQGATALAVLTTMSGSNKMMNILVITNSLYFQKDLEQFYGSMTIEKSLTQTVKPVAQVPAVAGSLSDYMFDIPAGWTKEVSSTEIVLRAPDKASVLSILPMQNSSGDLGKDMNTIYWQVFEGWKPDPWNPDNHISVKGTSAAGWSYFKDEMAIAKEDGEKQYKTYGFVFLAQLNGQLAVIAGSYPSKTNLLDDQSAPDWQIIFHSLGFKNYKNSAVSPLEKDILGEWITGSSSSVITYTFAANNRYAYGSAFSTSRDYSSYQVLETTTSFTGDGKYILMGNELTTINDKTGKTEVHKVRVYYEKQYGGWLKRLGILSISLTDGKSYELTMVSETK